MSDQKSSQRPSGQPPEYDAARVRCFTFHIYEIDSVAASAAGNCWIDEVAQRAHRRNRR
jgi:hypothetical protein